MSNRFLFNEDHQLPAKIIRAVIWSGTMGVLWVLPFVAFFVATGLMSSFQSAPAASDYSGLAFGLLFMGLGACALVAFITGTTVGALAGFESQPKDPFFPFRVPLFSSTLKWVGVVIILMSVGAITAAIAS